MTSTGVHKRIVPSSGEALPVIGVGTWKGFDVAPNSKEYAALADVLRTLFALGGSVIDSSPMYGRAEEIVGKLLTETGTHEKAFVATKVWTRGRSAGIDRMRRSMALLQRPSIDLMQIHNLVDWREHLATLREWKYEGRIKYLGITHYESSGHNDLEHIMRTEALDFVQFNYPLDEREAERRLLPLAAERGIAVLVNRPFGTGRLIKSLQAKPVPGWMEEIGCATWSQVLLKFVLAHKAVTCVIPGTGRPEHMAEDCHAGIGPLPDESLRKRLIALWDSGQR